MCCVDRLRPPRKNVARSVGLAGLAEHWNGKGDPWDSLFDIAGRSLRQNQKVESELMPYWIYEEVENPARVERLVPLPPFSSENAKFKALKRSLAVYRLAFGQPRQEDLIEYLVSAHEDLDEQSLRALQLNLAP